jgi:hypothetical protein
MSEVHDQAIHLLARPDPGTYLTPESREMVLRAIEEAADLRKEIVRLQEVAAASQRLFGVKVARVEFLMHDDGTVNLIATCPGSDEKALAIYCGEQLQRIFDEAALLKDSPAAPKEDVEVPSDTPLPNGAAGDVSFAAIDPTLTPERIQQESDEDAAAMLAEEMAGADCHLSPEKKKRNTPDLCVVDGCTEKGASRNQWCCGSHAAKLNLTERRAALDAWKKARMNGQAPTGGAP